MLCPSSLRQFSVGFAAAVCQSLLTFTSEFSTKHNGFGLVQVTFFAYSCAFAIGVIIIGARKPLRHRLSDAFDGVLQLDRDYALMYAAVCFCDPLSFLLTFAAVTKMDSGDCLALVQSTQVLVAGAIAVRYFKQPFTALMTLQWSACIAGTLCIAQPQFLFGSDDEKERGDHSAMAVFFSVATGVVMAVGNSLIHKLQSEVDIRAIVAGTVMCGFLIVVVFICVLLLVAQKTGGVFKAPIDSWDDWVSIVGVGTVMFCGQVLDASAFYFGELNRMTVVTCLSIVAGYLLELAFLNEKESAMAYIGAAFIVFGSVLTPLWEIAHETESDNENESEETHTQPITAKGNGYYDSIHCDKKSEHESETRQLLKADATDSWPAKVD